MTNWLITGGCGFIGTNLISKLIKEPDNKILVLDNLTVGSRASLGEISDFTSIDPQSDKVSWDESVSLVEGDILDLPTVSYCLNGADVVVHLAANTGVGPSVKDPFYDCQANVVGTLNVLEAARHNSVKNFVFASSGAPLGEQVPPLNEKLAPRPASPYGASKLAGEGYCSAYHHSFGLSTVSLRFGNVYGGRSEMKESVVAKFIKCAIGNIPFEVYGTGEQTRDFIYIDDLVRAVCLAASTPEIGGETLQIATSRETNINELIEAMQRALVSQGLPPAVVKFTQARAGDVKRNFSDTTKAKQMLGWEANETLSSGIEKTIKYYQSKLS
jgi:UDP-glucose 4-epimerase